MPSPRGANNVWAPNTPESTQQDERRIRRGSDHGELHKTQSAISSNEAGNKSPLCRLSTQKTSGSRLFLAGESSEGPLETMAPNYANLALFLEIGMGLALLAGAMFARRKRFRLHACCQTVIVLLNFVVILLLMLPSFRVHVIPKIPAKLGKPYYAVATAHAALGSVAEAAALYIVLSAGTNLLPQRVRFTNYKLWMRSGGLYSWWAWRLMPVGMSLICFGDRNNLQVAPSQALSWA